MTAPPIAPRRTLSRSAVLRRLHALEPPWLVAPGGIPPAVAVLHWRPSQGAWLLLGSGPPDEQTLDLAAKLDDQGVPWARVATWEDVLEALRAWRLVDLEGRATEPSADWPRWAPEVLHWLSHMTIEQACARAGVTRQAHYDLRNRSASYRSAAEQARRRYER